MCLLHALHIPSFIPFHPFSSFFFEKGRNRQGRDTAGKLLYFLYHYYYYCYLLVLLLLSLLILLLLSLRLLLLLLLLLLSLLLLPSSSLSLCLQDPHFKTANHRRRIIQTFLLAEYAFILAVDGVLYTITDVQELGEWMRSKLDAHQLFQR